MRKVINYFNAILIFCLADCKITNLNTLKNQGFYKISRFANEIDNSDSSIVSGHVFDLKFQNSLRYAIVFVKDKKMGCMADECGDFQLKIKPGVYSFVFQMVGNTELITSKIKIEPKTRYHIVVYLDSYVMYQID